MLGSTRTCRPALVGLVLALTLAACGGPDDAVEQDPRGSLRDAFDALADYEGYELRLAIRIDDDAVAAAVADDDLTADDADRINDSSLLVRTNDQGTGRRIEYVLTVAGDDVAEVRTVPASYEVYFRLDLEAFFELADDPDADTSVEEFVEDSERLGFGDLGTALRDGAWVRLTGIQQVMNLYEGILRSLLGTDLDGLQEAWAQAAGETMATLGRLLDDGIAVEHVGNEDAGARVRATIDGDALRVLVADGLTSFADTDVIRGLPEDLVADLDAGLRELEEAVPTDLTVSLDAWISDGRLRQVALDVTQFPDVPDDGEVLLVLGIDEFTGAIEPPSGDVVEVDLFRLFGRSLGSLFDPGPFDEPDPFGQP